jgi:hypothetical protein
MDVAQVGQISRKSGIAVIAAKLEGGARDAQDRVVIARFGGPYAEAGLGKRVETEAVGRGVLS